MPVIEVGLVIGWLGAWALRKARRAGGRLDTTTDAAMDAGLDRLDALVRDKLAGHPALRDLDEEAAAVHDPPELSGSKAPASGTPVGPGTPAESAGFISELTRQQLELSLRAALAKDAAFADRLAEAAATVRAADPTPPVQGGTSMKANASGYGRVYQAGRDQHINDR